MLLWDFRVSRGRGEGEGAGGWEAGLLQSPLGKPRHVEMQGEDKEQNPRAEQQQGTRGDRPCACALVCLILQSLRRGC